MCGGSGRFDAHGNRAQMGNAGDRVEVIHAGQTGDRTSGWRGTLLIEPAAEAVHHGQRSRPQTVVGTQAHADLAMTGRDRRSRMNQLIAQMGLDTVRRSKGYVLSGGERRRVEIARALAIDPGFLLLDEPFSGIDPIQVLELQKIVLDLKRQGIGILVTDHNVRETLTVTDRAYIINAGKIFRSGSPDELTQDAEVRRVYLGESFSFQLP